MHKWMLLTSRRCAPASESLRWSLPGAAAGQSTPRGSGRRGRKGRRGASRRSRRMPWCWPRAALQPARSCSSAMLLRPRSWAQPTAPLPLGRGWSWAHRQAGGCLGGARTASPGWLRRCGVGPCCRGAVACRASCSLGHPHPLHARAATTHAGSRGLAAQLPSRQAALACALAGAALVDVDQVQLNPTGESARAARQASGTAQPCRAVVRCGMVRCTERKLPPLPGTRRCVCCHAGQPIRANCRQTF